MSRAWIPYVVLTAGLIISIAVAAALWRAADTRDLARFDAQAERARDDVASQVETYVALLRGTAGLFAASDQITRDQFHVYAEKLQLDERYRGIQGIGFSRRVPPQEVDEVVAQMRAQGIEGFHIWPDGERAEYHSIVYLEPEDFRNEAAIGYDMFSEPTRRAAMERARDAGTAAASAPVSLVQELSDENPQAGFVTYVPVYAGGTPPATVEERRERLIGFAYGPFRIDDLLGGILGGEHRALDVQVYDGQQPDPERRIHRTGVPHGPPARERQARFTRTHTISVAGRPWTLVFTSSPRFEAGATTASIPYVLLAGVLLTILLSAVTRAQVAARENAERAAAELRQSEQALWTLNETLEQRVVKRTAEAEQRAGQLRRMAARLTQAEQQERRRLAQVLHDHLQQLLVAARMQIGMLRRRHADPNAQEAIHDVDELIQQSIEASRSLTLELSPPVLYDADFSVALDWLARQMQSKYQLNVDIDADPGADPADQDTRVFLFQAIRELLFNIVKHGGTSQARLTLSRDDDARVRVVVEDEGKGFDLEAVELTGGEDGGFGLFSIRERIELLGGEFRIDSRPGRGTRIELLAPLGHIDEPPADAEVLGQIGAALDHVGAVEPPVDEHRDPKEKIRVLLVDDHRIVRAGLAGLLRSQPDMEVVGEAADGQTALELARQLRPDVISMDVTMPRMSGVEATRLIRSEMPGIRVVALSMHEKNDMDRAMREAGAAAYVPKDGPADVLLAAIRGTEPANV